MAQSKDIYHPITAIDVSAANFSLKLNMAQTECEPFLFSIGLWILSVCVSYPPRFALI